MKGHVFVVETWISITSCNIKIRLSQIPTFLKEILDQKILS